jgi:hypothetical protein
VLKWSNTKGERANEPTTPQPLAKVLRPEWWREMLPNLLQIAAVEVLRRGAFKTWANVDFKWDFKEAPK